MKNRSALLFWTDLLLAAELLALAATGVIVRWVLPAGSGGRPGGHRASRTLWELSRHQWGEVHLWIAIALLATVLLHLALHWGWIKGSLVRHLWPGRTQRALND